MRQNGVRSNVRFPYGSKGMKKGGKAKKQGYDDRLDESLGARHGKNLKATKLEEKNLKAWKKLWEEENMLLLKLWTKGVEKKHKEKL